jgi:SAM-dependent methyltransferase
LFLEWLGARPAAHWLDVGCGTGALTAAICTLAGPCSVIACDPAESFVAHARRQVTDPRASFLVAGADALPRREGGFDAVVSALVLNFLPAPDRAVAAMRERLGKGGTVGAYVWDYASGLELLRHFWDEAAASDSRAAALDEGRRFPLCQPPALSSIFHSAGLGSVHTAALDIETELADFDDYWTPFLGGTGPAPSYVASLDPDQRESLKERLHRRLPAGKDGRIRLRARAWAVRGIRD